jgi:Sec-independent protein translocase protein TatA
MDILGIGPLELFFIILIALIVLGPKDMVKAGRTIGKFMRTVVTSPNWQMLQQASREIRGLPNRLMREAGIDEFQEGLPNSNTVSRTLGLDEIEKDIGSIKSDMSDWTTPPPDSETTPSITNSNQEAPTPEYYQEAEFSIESGEDIDTD